MANASSTASSAEKNDRELAKHGINLFLNNQVSEAEKIFENPKDLAVRMRVGFCFMEFLVRKVNVFEDRINSTIQIMKDTENKFAHQISSFQLMKKRVLGKGETNVEERLEVQISVADCQLFMALLTFTQQEVTTYVKGGWILRKSWKIYDRTYREIKDLYENYFGIPISYKGQTLSESSTDDLTDPANWISSSSGESVAGGELSKKSSKSSQDLRLSRSRSQSKTSGLDVDLPDEAIIRLVSSVSFGYGTIQLCISLLPPNLLKLIHFLGFEGDREVGLDALKTARLGDTVRAPYASFALLWYHTLVRPFCAIDGDNVSAGVGDAQAVLDEMKDDYGAGSIFLFFRGRTERLKSQLDKALEANQQAMNSSNQREMRLMCLQEIGWCHILKFNWKEAYDSFLKLKEDSKYAKGFFGYVAFVSLGILDKKAECQKLLAEIPSLVKNKNNPLESFALRRAQRFLKMSISNAEMHLFGLELIYLWHSIPSCSAAVIDKMLEICGKITDKNWLPLKCLIEGAVHNQKGNTNLAVQHFEESIANSDDSGKEEIHIPAHATYELSIVFLKKPDTFSRGKALLFHVKDDFKGYDFENRLNVRIHAAVKNLESAPTS